MSQCAVCVPVWRILYHVIVSCKGPIQAVSAECKGVGVGYKGSCFLLLLLLYPTPTPLDTSICHTSSSIVTLLSRQFTALVKKNTNTLRLSITNLKPVTHQAILYDDCACNNQRKLSGVPCVVMAIFADHCNRCIKSPISGLSDISN